MGTVYRETYIKPLPTGSELFTKGGERFARWKPLKGKTRTAPVTAGQDGTDRIVVTSEPTSLSFATGAGWCAKSQPAAAMRMPLGRFSPSYNAGLNW